MAGEWKRLFSILVLGILCTVPAPGDEVRLDNGDRMTGTAIRMTEGELLFETAYAGEITLDWNAVESLAVDSPTTFLLEGETPGRLRGSVTSSEGGLLRIRAEGLREEVSVGLDEIVAINPVEEPPVRLDGHANVGFQDRSGNTDTRDLHLEGELVARTEKNRYRLGGSLGESESDGEETASRSSLYSEYDHFLSERWYFNGNMRFTEDEFQNLNLRSSFGIGGGYQVWDAPARSLSVELGVNLVNEDFIGAPDEDFTAGRWNLNGEHRLFHDDLRLFHRHEVLFSLEESEDLVLLTRTGVRIFVLESFNATLEYGFDYDDSPVGDLEKEDRALLVTLGYAW